MPDDSALRKHLLELLNGGQAHVTLDEATSDFPLEQAGERPAGSPHSAWELLAHLRIAQRDILRFSQSANYQSPPWPKGYWPSSPAPEGQAEWKGCLDEIRDDLAEFVEMIRDPEQDLLRPFPWGEGQTLLREALLIADHNAYHIGQIVLVRRLLAAWE
jgi:uncharacterized damage-inducible protein DinB